jgi:hypothetical protein
MPLTDTISTRLNRGPLPAGHNAPAAARDCIQSASQALDSWVEREGFRGWDPHDALNSRLLRRLTFHNRIAGIFWLQLFKRNPFNFRSWFGVPKGYNPKAMGLFLGSYIRKFQLARNPRDLRRIDFLASWLLTNVTPGYHGACWGYNFDWPNRSFFAPAGTPTIVNTAFIALAFMDMHCLLSENRSQNITSSARETGKKGPDQWRWTGPSPLSVARSACDFVLQDLSRSRPTQSELCFSYTPRDARLVHNANMMGAWLLASVFRKTGEPHLAEAALAAARFTTRRQRADGSWRYGEAPSDQWVDNFHTGFVLEALRRTAACLQTSEFRETLLKGYHFWKGCMFLGDGTPKYYPRETYPIDVHSVAQAILTFLEFRESDREAEDWALRVARWGVENLQDHSGYFHYQIRRSYRIRIPYMRWSQAWMQRALTKLIHQRGSEMVTMLS